jgi:3-hydroxy-9,10-secoandrosta-1,3,5(10)-triene-9,17-dione monooxygenase reductase component
MTTSTHAPAEIERGLFRRVMGRFATGVAVIATRDRRGLAGMTVNSLTSVSLSPALLLVCLARDTRTAEAVRARGAFTVNLLSASQGALSDRFARPGEDPFRDLPVELSDDGLPVLEGGVGHLACSTEAIHPGGDHLVVVGRVTGGEPREGSPLVFFNGQYDTLTGRGSDAAIDWYW